MKLLVLACKWRQCKSSRTLALPSDWSLAELHEALQCAFGWEEEHLYSFTAPDGTTWSMQMDDDFLDDFGGEADRDPAKTALSEVFPHAKARLDYEYDFGDSNEVSIAFQKAIEGDGPACLEAAGLMAVEDSASFGYADGIANILRKGPGARFYRDLADWLDLESPEDAEAWIAGQTADAEKITAELARIRPAKKKRANPRRKP
ncbi:MAG: plasmid pRiA4b ORF-3 family protein [Kiritimatiellae bacterium]|nr:plasmid pRiA4b ORF-3 family protein [Kiritimatiellia bacterium]